MGGHSITGPSLRANYQSKVRANHAGTAGPDLLENAGRKIKNASAEPGARMLWARCALREMNGKNIRVLQSWYADGMGGEV
jgi:hypothetical protein